MPVSPTIALPLLETHEALPGAGSWLQCRKPPSRLPASILKVPSYDESHDALFGLTSARLQRRNREFHSFLSPEVSAATAGSPQRQHEDFLFGGSSSSRSATKQSDDLASNRVWRLPTPKQSMMQAVQALPAVAASLSSALAPVWKHVQPYVDPFSDQKQEEETGWCKNIPRVLRFSYWSDIISLLAVVHSMHYVCDTPLRTWLLGGIALGFPVTDLVNRVVLANDVRFKVVRLTIKRIRNGGNPEGFQLDSVSLYNKIGVPIHRSFVSERQEANYWFVEITDGPELVTGYQLITHRIEGSGTDPVSWVAEGSYDGVTWAVIDECDGEAMPMQREATSKLYDELQHLPDSQAAFRQGFLAEGAACAGAFAWLVLGTSWVSQGTEACIDSAPYLWYWSYFLVVVTWSCLGTVTIGLIISAVAMILLGGKSA